ncbi:MAG: hypothetical protein A4E69_03052 [Syntrophus sp. PtaB.Bin138]|nr:MAG: hypothetical protein A4E69_03052 [Syntrophus sp. PtaB.Bin138]
MKVAIPLFNDRISPHFSTAPEALLIHTKNDRIFSSWKIDLVPLSLPERKARILSLGVDVVLCGGIDRATRCWFEKRGIRVEDNRMGNALEMLDEHLTDKIHLSD